MSALLPVLLRRGNAMWFGWSGGSDDPYGPPASTHADGVEYVTLDLSPRQVDEYYAGFCNATLWPALHNLDDDATFDASGFQTYRSVNRWFAAMLFPRLKNDDVVWIHDYHLITVGRELRRLGWHGPVGYFHHTPIPDAEGWARIPHAELIAQTFNAYDLVGVQTPDDAARLSKIVAGGRTCRVGIFPAGIDPDRFRDLADSYPENPLHRARDDRQVIIGIDRLDYTKGIIERLEAFEQVLEDDPSVAERVRLVQWAAPSRDQVAKYREYRCDVERVAARINARHGELRPVHLEISTHGPAEVAAALRSADICLITSLADGMNLVSKEFAAVHGAANPGVLILSDNCGASRQLTDALMVHSTRVDSIVDAIRRAVEMPVAERIERSRKLRDAVNQYTAHDWADRFLAELLMAAEPVAGRGHLVAS